MLNCLLLLPPGYNEKTKESIRNVRAAVVVLVVETPAAAVEIVVVVFVELVDIGLQVPCTHTCPAGHPVR
jgi:hypothetical protein